MVFEDFQREHRIRGVLRALARQRVALLLQPGDVWVIEKAPKRFDGFEEALRTCHLRGWVDPIANAVPTGSLTPDGRLPEGPPYHTASEPIYRLTASGWSVLNRTQAWVFATLIIAAATLVATIVGTIVTCNLSR